jgi:hypothetical protein
MDYNTFYSPGKAFSNGECGGKELTWAEWQTYALGQDQHSTLHDIAEINTKQVLQAARGLLGM